MNVEIMPPAKFWGKTQYRLLEPTKVGTMTIPINFVTDGASVPRGLWWLLPPTSVYFKEAVLHDYLLVNHIFERSTCDKYFYEELKRNGKSEALARILYIGVRIGTLVDYISRLHK